MMTRVHWKFPQCSFWVSSNKREFLSLIAAICVIYLLHCLISWEQGSSELWNISFSDPDPYNVLNPPETLPSTGKHKIQKIIHQTWKTEYIPQRFIPWIKSWVDHHPDWQYWYWTDKSARQFMSDKYPGFLDVYDAYTEGIRRADAMRYFILYEFGGVYADLDMESVRALDNLTYKYNCFIGQEPYEHPALDGNFEYLAMNAIMGCQAKHPFMKAAMDALPDFAHFWNVLDSTGPHFITYVYNKYMKTLTDLQPENDKFMYLAPSQYFLPTIDPSKYIWFRYKCNRYESLTDIARKGCRGLKAYGYKRKPLSYSFTIHHWIHTYLYFQFNFSSRSPVIIYDIVPNVYIYGKRSSN